jgi:hypothetical protein
MNALGAECKTVRNPIKISDLANSAWLGGEVILKSWVSLSE